MGHAMSVSLLRASFPIISFDISAKTLDSFMSAASSIPGAQAQVASYPTVACRSVQLALVMVANQTHIESALLTLETGAIHSLVVHATVSPTFITGLRQSLDKDFHRPDLVLIDAPVSGGTARSANGTLTIMTSSTSLRAWTDPTSGQH
jgi:3-hydroxyisobutyrate dehydrogenase